jgi:hypothetical protein
MSLALPGHPPQARQAADPLVGHRLPPRPREARCRASAGFPCGTSDRAHGRGHGPRSGRTSCPPRGAARAPQSPATAQPHRPAVHGAVTAIGMRRLCTSRPQACAEPVRGGRGSPRSRCTRARRLRAHSPGKGGGARAGEGVGCSCSRLMHTTPPAPSQRASTRPTHAMSPADPSLHLPSLSPLADVDTLWRPALGGVTAKGFGVPVF